MVNPIWDNIFRRQKEQKSIVKWLVDNPLFSQLSKRELQFVENIVHVRHYRAGENVFRSGESGVGMFLITSGQVCIETPQEKIFLKEGDFFGELALIEDKSRRNVNALATVDTHLIGLFKPDLEEIKERQPGVGVKILSGLGRVLAARLQESLSQNQRYRTEQNKDLN